MDEKRPAEEKLRPEDFQELRARLPREFYLRNANQAAPDLLGKLLVHETPEGITAGRIVEVEAYIGSEDKGAHSYGYKRTKRTEIQFGPGGFAYVYAIYGLHACFNVVMNQVNQPEVILVRALEPVIGLDLMTLRRGGCGKTELCRGPGKLCQAMGITKAQYGADLCGTSLFLSPFQDPEEHTIMVSPRINIDYAEEYRDKLWRYYWKDSPYVSKTAKKYQDRQEPLTRQA